MFFNAGKAGSASLWDEQKIRYRFFMNRQWKAQVYLCFLERMNKETIYLLSNNRRVLRIIDEDQSEVNGVISRNSCFLAHVLTNIGMYIVIYSYSGNKKLLFIQ